MTISDLEIFFALYKYNRSKFQSVITELLDNKIEETSDSFLHILERKWNSRGYSFYGRKRLFWKNFNKLSLEFENNTNKIGE